MTESLATHAAAISDAARTIATAVLGGGRIVVDAGVGGPDRLTHHVDHVVVEFVHPVTAGRRAIPTVAASMTEAGPGDVVVDLGPTPPPGHGAAAVVWVGAWTHWDPFQDADLVTAYHLLWEAVHTWLDHREHDEAA